MGGQPSVEAKAFVVKASERLTCSEFNMKEFMDVMQETYSKDIPEEAYQEMREKGATEEDIAEFQQEYQDMQKQNLGTVQEWTARGGPNDQEIASTFCQVLSMIQEDQGIDPDDLGILLGRADDRTTLEKVILVFLTSRASEFAQTCTRTVLVSDEEFERVSALPEAEVPVDCDFGVFLPEDAEVTPKTHTDTGHEVPHTYTQAATEPIRNVGGVGADGEVYLEEGEDPNSSAAQMLQRVAEALRGGTEDSDRIQVMDDEDDSDSDVIEDEDDSDSE